MPPNQSEELTMFYKDILNWVNGGCPKSNVFEPYVGLCQNLANYGQFYEYYGYQVLNEMRMQFNSADLGRFPFNGDINSYCAEQDTETLYSNPKRLKWIKDHV